MNTASLNPGDHIEVSVKGVTFPATLLRKGKGLVGIEPHDPKRFTWRSVSPRCIVRKLERQERLA